MVAFVAVTGVAVAENSYTPKTHMNVRLGEDNVPFYTTFHKLTSMKDDNLLGGRLMVTGVYGRSVNSTNFGKNFGVAGSNAVQVTDVSGTLDETTLIGNTVPGDLLLHETGGSVEVAGTIKNHPRQRYMGLRLDYVHRLDKLLAGLYAGAFVPFYRYTNSMGIDIDSATDHVQANIKNITLMDLLTGNELTRTNDSDVHTVLNYGKRCNNSATSLGDIEAYVGWNFVEKEKVQAGINAGMIFPTAKKPNATYLFGARTGDKKWGIRLGADARARLWESKDQKQNLDVVGSVLYKYLFSGTEKRTLGLSQFRYNDAGGDTQILKDKALSELFLVGEVGKAGLQPLANVSTLDVKIKGRSMVEGQVALAYNHGGLTLDLGYNLLWKNGEDCSLKSPSCSSAWTDNKYGVANNAYDATAEFAAADTLAGTAEGLIQSSDLNLRAVEAPSKLAHKVFAGVGYTTKSWDYPLSFGAGVAYELGSNNKDALEGYSTFVKAGIAF